MYIGQKNPGPFTDFLDIDTTFWYLKYFGNAPLVPDDIHQMIVIVQTSEEDHCYGSYQDRYKFLDLESRQYGDCIWKPS